jgi:hypothetical protein
MEPEGSLPCSQQPPLVPILSQINPIHIMPSYLSKIHFNIVHPPTSWPSQWSHWHHIELKCIYINHNNNNNNVLIYTHNSTGRGQLQRQQEYKATKIQTNMHTKTNQKKLSQLIHNNNNNNNNNNEDNFYWFMFWTRQLVASYRVSTNFKRNINMRTKTKRKT